MEDRHLQPFFLPPSPPFTRMRAGYLASLANLAAVGLASLPSKLVPSKRAVTLEQRSLWTRDIVPKDTIVLNYGTGRALCHSIPISY